MPGHKAYDSLHNSERRKLEHKDKSLKRLTNVGYHYFLNDEAEN